jgi:hypothetical protein
MKFSIFSHVEFRLAYIDLDIDVCTKTDSLIEKVAQSFGTTDFTLQTESGKILILNQPLHHYFGLDNNNGASVKLIYNQYAINRSREEIQGYINNFYISHPQFTQPGSKFIKKNHSKDLDEYINNVNDLDEYMNNLNEVSYDLDEYMNDLNEVSYDSDDSYDSDEYTNEVSYESDCDCKYINCKCNKTGTIFAYVYSLSLLTILTGSITVIAYTLHKNTKK